MATWEDDADLLHSSGARHALILSGGSPALGQLAGGLAQALAPRQIHITSAGSAAAAIDPLARRVLAELSVDTADLRLKALAEVDAADVQAVLVVSKEDAPPVGAAKAVRVHWPLTDPAAGGGTEAEKLARYRAVRNELRRRLIRVFARNLDHTAAPSATTTSIGPASGGDLDGIKRLLIGSLLPSRDVGGASQRFIVASEAGRLLGCAGLQVSGEDGLVRSMAVHWTRRNAGLGTRLHQRLLFEATLAGVKRLYVVTATAEDFFAGHGFKKIAAKDVPVELQASEEFTAFAPGGGTVMSRAVAAG